MEADNFGQPPLTLQQHGVPPLQQRQQQQQQQQQQQLGSTPTDMSTTGGGSSSSSNNGAAAGAAVPTTMGASPSGQTPTAVASSAAAAAGLDASPPILMGNFSTAHHQNMMQNERQVVRAAGRTAIRQFLEQHQCFAVLRASGKVVVFDTRIPIQLAFYALVEHDMQAAPLWDPVTAQFTGLLTVTDFIDILRHYRQTQKDVASLAVTSIADILIDCAAATTTTTTATAAAAAANNNGTTTANPASAKASGEAADADAKDTAIAEPTPDASASSSSSGSNLSHRPVVQPRKFVGADSTCTLKQACFQLQQENMDFLPVVYAADMRVLACITYTNILEHLVTHFREQRRLFDDSVYDLGIGTYRGGDDESEEETRLFTVRPDNTLADALEIMHRHNLSALPVVVDVEEAVGAGGLEKTAATANDGQGESADAASAGSKKKAKKQKIIGVYSRSDITFLTKATDAQDAVRNLDLPVETVMQQHRSDVTTPDALRTCLPQATLQSIFESFAQVRFHRLYVVDANDHLLGVVSARDLVAYFLRDDEESLAMQQQQ